MPSSNMHSVFKNVVHVVSTLWLIDHCSIWTSWSAGSDVDNDARTQRSQNLALNIYMQYISFYSPPSTSIIPVRTAFWCPELCWWCQPPTEFEITGKLCGFKLSICRICVHIFPNYINVDAVTICPTGFDASWSKLVPTRQNGFRRPTFVVVICGVNVGRGGNLTLCRLVHEVLGASVRELPLPLLPGLFWSAQPKWGIETTPPTRRNWAIPGCRGGGWRSRTGICPVSFSILLKEFATLRGQGHDILNGPSKHACFWETWTPKNSLKILANTFSDSLAILQKICRQIHGSLLIPTTLSKTFMHFLPVPIP